MLELKNMSKRGLPNWVKLEKSIPGYADMEMHAQRHYKDLYLLACYPELLGYKKDEVGTDVSLLPQELSDVQALVYFIFYHNLAYLPNGEEIYPLLNFEWSEDKGLQLGVVTNRSKLLLPTLRLLDSMPPVYFTALMLSFALFQKYDPEASEYIVCFRLLEALLTGTYSDAFEQLRKPMMESSDYGWFFRYLPRGENSDFSSILDDDKVKDARVALVGMPDCESQIFHKP